MLCTFAYPASLSILFQKYTPCFCNYPSQWKENNNNIVLAEHNMSLHTIKENAAPIIRMSYLVSHLIFKQCEERNQHLFFWSNPMRHYQNIHFHYIQGGTSDRWQTHSSRWSFSHEDTDVHLHSQGIVERLCLTPPYCHFHPILPAPDILFSDKPFCQMRVYRYLISP